jgi:tetratricopeptide (TPR) repeat protein
VALVALSTAALGARAVARNPAWRDNTALALSDVALAPRSAKLQLGAGLALHEAGDARGAEAAFRAAVAIWPDYAQARFNLGQLLQQRGAEAEAIEQLETAARLSPSNPRPYKSLAPMLDRRGERQRALDAYRRGALLDPSDLGLRFNYGRALHAAGRPSEAREVLESLVRDAPGALEGHLARALLHEAAGDAASALAVYREIARRPDLPPDVRRRVAARLGVAGVEPGR